MRRWDIGAFLILCIRLDMQRLNTMLEKYFYLISVCRL